ncbi:GntR family transcriptional regulator [Mycobacterium sp. E2462]|nr:MULTISPECIES: GntR family transcriptional regulator [unclassified Mycobacterium]OBG71934.1 GntR family transcriptional regulator [Mycobacterium sp. E1214]OBH24902.1 GntR family transcriptional regulator [Mycobacterium sp. E1319]OBI05264.1 GntR family transcriptional regulator [Mycobacterium sp. E2462]
MPLREQILGVLLDGLISGRWQPGDRIVERQVATELNVSQAPVREALRDLEALRLVSSEPNKGARVRDIGAGDLLEMYPVRAALEGLAASLAVDKLAGDVTALQRHTDEIRRAAELGDVGMQVRAGVAFHREIVASSGNAVLLAVWESLGIEVWTNLSLRLLRTGLHDNVDDHTAIVDAFARHDPNVGELVREHVLSYCHGSPTDVGS